MHSWTITTQFIQKIEFIVEQIPPSADKASSPDTAIPFHISPPNSSFKLSGRLGSNTCAITRPFTGEVQVDEMAEGKTIRSVELQLVRVETCSTGEGFEKEATEIQNIQIIDGDIPKKLTVPLFMVFPRLFCTPTLSTRLFKVEFEINVVVLLADGTTVTENFPIRLIRG